MFDDFSGYEPTVPGSSVIGVSVSQECDRCGLDDRLGSDPAALVRVVADRIGAKALIEALVDGVDPDALADAVTVHVDPVALASRALAAVDPTVLTSGARREVLVGLQGLASQVAAVAGEVLVAECGPARRVREVQVAAEDAFAKPETLAARTGGTVVDVTYDSEPVSGLRSITLADEAVDELAALLHRTPGSVVFELRRARLLHGPLAPVRQVLAAGGVSVRHAQVIADQAGRMMTTPLGESVEQDAVFAAKCAMLTERVLPTATASTWQRTESTCRRLVVQIDAAAERARRRRAKTQADVYATAEDDGMASITARMPALDAARAIATIDAHTTTTMTSPSPLLDDPAATIGQHRVAAFLDLLHGSHIVSSAAPVTDRSTGDNPGAAHTDPSGDGYTDIAHVAAVGHTAGTVDETHRRYLSRDVDADIVRATGAGHGTTASPARGRAGARVEVQVLVDARVLTGLVPDGSGFVQVGRGDLEPVDRDAILDLLTDSSTPVVLRRLLVDPASGALVDRGAKTYTPTPDLTAWLATRDQTCRFPGCAAKAARCDVDHATDFGQGGPTTIANTGLLCRRHHNRKTHAQWRIENSKPDGSCTFIAPDGRRHAHQPTTLTDLMAVPRPPGAVEHESDEPDVADNIERTPPEPGSAEHPPTTPAWLRRATNASANPVAESPRPSCSHDACSQGVARVTDAPCTAPFGRDPHTGEPWPF